jgi:hypothetical protein
MRSMQCASTRTSGNMSMAAHIVEPSVEGVAQRKRFRKWQNLAPPQTRFLSTSVESQLVPLLESKGFRCVDFWMEQRDQPVGGAEIELERVKDDLIDSINFNFETYRTPRLQVHGARRRRSPSLDFIRSANLVARRRQYYHFWGKPWWLPTRFWADGRSVRTIATIADRIGQLVHFLETGVLGPNVSRQDD